MLLDLDPIAFQIGPLDVYWYGVFMAISFVIGTAYFYTSAKKLRINEDFLLNLIIIAIVVGLLGARLIYVLANHPEWFVSDPIKVIEIYRGGLAWHGALLGGVLAGWWYVRRKGMNFNLLADLAVPGVAVGYTLIRVGNIFNQEILGRMTSFEFGLWPAQPIGSMIALILLVRYFYLQGKNLPPGYQFWSFIFYHQLMRGVIEESVRDNPLVLWGYVVPDLGLGFFTLAQLATPFIMIFTFIMMRRTFKQDRGAVLFK